MSFPSLATGLPSRAGGNFAGGPVQPSIRTARAFVSAPASTATVIAGIRATVTVHR